MHLVPLVPIQPGLSNDATFSVAVKANLTHIMFFLFPSSAFFLQEFSAVYLNQKTGMTADTNKKVRRKIVFESGNPK